MPECLICGIETTNRYSKGSWYGNPKDNKPICFECYVNPHCDDEGNPHQEHCQKIKNISLPCNCNYRKLEINFKE
ncbi:MAG: hypothetical protein PHY56_00645 [Candidatus Omnitrophica bacterium]|jgi:hypothetical protein|nr:hypothetical protein [Candidatus Omnitrophota bacterium]